MFFWNSMKAFATVSISASVPSHFIVLREYKMKRQFSFVYPLDGSILSMLGERIEGPARPTVVRNSMPDKTHRPVQFFLHQSPSRSNGIPYFLERAFAPFIRWRAMDDVFLISFASSFPSLLRREGRSRKCGALALDSFRHYFSCVCCIFSSALPDRIDTETSIYNRHQDRFFASCTQRQIPCRKLGSSFSGQEIFSDYKQKREQSVPLDFSDKNRDLYNASNSTHCRADSAETPHCIRVGRTSLAAVECAASLSLVGSHFFSRSLSMIRRISSPTDMPSSLARLSSHLICGSVRWTDRLIGHLSGGAPMVAYKAPRYRYVKRACRW